MVEYTSMFKLYFMKDTNKVKLAIKVTNNLVNEYFFNQDQFDHIIDNWNTKQGVEIKVDNIKWSICHKKSFPRPIDHCPTSYVKISVYVNGMVFHYRATFDEMICLTKDYFYQKNNKMHWDN